MTNRSNLGVGLMVAAVLLLGGCSPGDEPPVTPSATGQPTVGGPTPSATSVAPTGGTPQTTAGSAEPPAPTTPVPPPSTGDVRRTVRPRPVESRPPVDLDDESTAEPGVQVRLASVRRVTATAQLPGEVAGPALAVTVAVDNGSGERIGLTDVVVDLIDSSGGPGNPVSTPPARPLPGSLPQGRDAEGVYVFTVAEERQRSVTVTVSLSPDQPVLVFRGRVR